MSGKKEKKKSFKDILRDSFPVDMDGLLGEQEEERLPHEPSPAVQVESAVELHTISPQATGPPRGTVTYLDTVSPQGTVSREGTVSHGDTVASPDTVSSLGIASQNESDSISHEFPEQSRVEITSNYFLMDADVFDVLAPEQDAYEQIVYGYLYRQSYGRNRQTCFVGLKALIEGCRLSKNSVRRTLTRLEQKKHIAVMERVNQRNMKGTIYRVYLPCEIAGLNSHTTFETQQ